MNVIFKDVLDSYLRFTGKAPDSMLALAPTASNRKYFRLTSGKKSLIASYNPDRTENEAFLYIRSQLAMAGVSVPEILYTDLDHNIYMQADLGDTMLLSIIEACRSKNSPEYLAWYKKVIEQMPAIQYKASRKFDFTRCYPRGEFDEQSILWDLNYFKYYFLKMKYIPFHEQKLENDFNVLAGFLMEADSSFFMFRDFQSRNIMVHQDQVYFIDFQGGRKGALQYDLASLLFEAKADLSPEERHILLNHYLDVFKEFPFFNRDSFLKYFPAFCMIRLLQAFGAYGFRGLIEKKVLFLQSIPPAVKNLKWILENFDTGIKIPHLEETLSHLIASPEFFETPDLSGKLQVSLNSFSFRKGIPDDYSGNGGGFVFDCRGLPNPYRFEHFKDQTGLDPGVIDFLKDKTEVKEFIGHAAAMVSSTIKDYQERKHEHLMVSFGCTGGQHRSVYCAGQLYQLLSKEFDVWIRLNHQELEVTKDGGKHVQEKGKETEESNEKAG